jgi:YesN/AraC family two-component response regulator
LFLKGRGIRHILGAGTPFEDVCQIEISYTYARECAGDLQKVERTYKKEEESSTETVEKVCVFLEKNYPHKLTLEEIAKVVGYSKYHLGRMFKEKMGTTIVEHLIHIRIEKAKLLLKQEDYSIRQISEKVGYADPNYFTLSFKRMEGITPIEFRYNTP